MDEAPKGGGTGCPCMLTEGVGCSYRWDDEALTICDCTWLRDAARGHPPPS